MPLWQVIGWGLVVTAVYLSLTPKPPEVDLGFSGEDKLFHLLTYGAMMGWFMQLYETPRWRGAYAVGFVLLGVLLEVGQWLGGVRHPEAADAVANSLGVVLGWMTGRTRLGVLLSHLERRLLGSG